MTVIQNYTTRYSSIAYKIHRLVSESGPGYFFSEQVPFSIRNGSVFASRLVDYFVEHVVPKYDSKPQYIVYEFGAGLGMLTYFFLRLLKANHPDIYEKTQCVVSDGSRDIVGRLSGYNIWSDFGDHISFDVVKAVSLKIKKKPIFCFSSYLLDSLPVRHLKVSKGDLYEVFVQTELDDSVRFFDTAVFPPQKMDQTKIAFSDFESLVSVNPSFVNQLSGQLKETYKIKKIKELPYWSKEAVDKLYAYIKQCDIKDGIYFNYSDYWFRHIDAVLGSMESGGSYLISDFGFSNSISYTSADSLVSRYGNMAYFSVNFSSILEYMGSKNYYGMMTNRPMDQTQELVISKEKFESKTCDFFDTQFTELGYEGISDFIEWFMLLKSVDSDEVDERFEALSEYEKEDYYLLKTIILRLFQERAWPRAMPYIQKMFTLYKQLAYDAQLILAWMGQSTGEYDTGMECLEQVLLISPNDSVVFGSMASLYFLKGDLEKAEKCMKHSISLLRPGNLDQQIYFLLKLFEKSKDDQQLTLVKNWFEGILENEPDMISESIKKLMKTK